MRSRGKQISKFQVSLVYKHRTARTTERNKEKRNTKSNVGAKVCADRDKEKWNKRSGVLRMRLDSANPCEKSGAKEPSVSKATTNQS